jgi:methyl-accepting chemotaxis protein
MPAALQKLADRLLFYRRLRIRGKLFLITLVVLLGFGGSFALFSTLVDKVKIGGAQYREIHGNLTLMEAIALLKSDLNQVRAEMLALATEENSDSAAQAATALVGLKTTIDERFTATRALLGSEEKQLAFEDAQSTWREFYETILQEIIPLVSAGKNTEARQLALGMQAQRYTRFIDQVDALVMTLQLENEELENRVTALTRSRLLMTSIMSAGALLAVFLLLFFFSLSLSRRIGRLSRLAQSVAEGDLSASADMAAAGSAHSRDEIAALYESFSTMRAGLRRMHERIRSAFRELEAGVEKIGGCAGTIQEGARSQSTALSNVDAIVARLDEGFGSVTERMSRLSGASDQTSASIQEMMASIGQVAGNASSLFSSVEETALGMEGILRANKEVAGNIATLSALLETTSSSVTEIDASIKEVQGLAEHSQNLASEVKQGAREDGGGAVAAITAEMEKIRAAVVTLSSTMGKLSDSVVNIGEILVIIDDVAEQTNLLALNAAIIAAQAGEHGRGFSVVAEEIRELAQRTASSTREITKVIDGVRRETRSVDDLVRETVSRVDTGVEAVRRTDRSLAKIIERSDKAEEMSARIARATEEQANGSRSVAHAVQDVNVKAGQIAHSTREQTTGSEYIARSIEQMREQAAQVRRATGEQTMGARLIAEAGAQTLELTREVGASTQESKALLGDVVGRVVAAGHSVQSAVAVAAQLDDLLKQFNDLTRELRTTLDQYRT